MVNTLLSVMHMRRFQQAIRLLASIEHCAELGNEELLLRIGKPFTCLGQRRDCSCAVRFACSSHSGWHFSTVHTTGIDLQCWVRAGSWA